MLIYESLMNYKYRLYWQQLTPHLSTNSNVIAMVSTHVVKLWAVMSFKGETLAKQPKSYGFILFNRDSNGIIMEQEWDMNGYTLRFHQTSQWKIPYKWRCQSEKIIDKWWIFHCHVWLPKGIVLIHWYNLRWTAARQLCMDGVGTAQL